MINMALCVMLLMREASITCAMALAYQLDAISQGLKNSQFPGPNPLPLAQHCKSGPSQYELYIPWKELDLFSWERQS